MTFEPLNGAIAGSALTDEGAATHFIVWSVLENNWPSTEISKGCGCNDALQLIEHVAFDGEVFATTPTTLPRRQDVMRDASSTSNSNSCGVAANRNGLTLFTDGIRTYAKIGPSEDQSAPLLADTAKATDPTPSSAPAANEGGATQEA